VRFGHKLNVPNKLGSVRLGRIHLYRTLSRTPAMPLGDQCAEVRLAQVGDEHREQRAGVRQQ